MPVSTSEGQSFDVLGREVVEYDGIDMIPKNFLPSRDLPTLFNRSQDTKSIEKLSNEIKFGLRCIGFALGCAKGQSEQINVEIETIKREDLQLFLQDIELGQDDYDEEDHLDEFESQFVKRWLLNLNYLSWPETNTLEEEDLIEFILSESSRLIAILSGQSASSGLNRTYSFNSFKDDKNLSISTKISDTAVVEDSLGGRTWNSSPLLANYMLDILTNPSEEEEGEGCINFLELGAGTGLTGLTVALGLQRLKTKARIHLSDFNENVLKNLRLNANLNGLRLMEKDYLQDFQIFPFDWSEALMEGTQSNKVPFNTLYDSILCADCIYEPQHAHLIHAVASKLLSQKHLIKTKKDLNSNEVKGKMFVLSPIRQNLIEELNALYQIFPHVQIDRLTSIDDGKPRLRITHQKEFIMASKDNFGPPKLRSHFNIIPISHLHAYTTTIDNRLDQFPISSFPGLMYRLHTIEWCNIIDQ